MPNKDFTAAASSGASAFQNIISPEGEPPKETDTIQDPPKKVRRDPRYRVNLAFPPEYEYHLKTAAYNASTPFHPVSITEYIRRLIEKDMKDNPQPQGGHQGENGQ